MEIQNLTLIVLSINYLIDHGYTMTKEDVNGYLEKGSLFKELNKMSDEIRMAGLQRILHTEFNDSDVLQNALRSIADAYGSEPFGVDDEKNGLLFINGLINEVIQRSKVTIDLKNY